MFANLTSMKEDFLSLLILSASAMIFLLLVGALLLNYWLGGGPIVTDGLMIAFMAMVMWLVRP